MSRSNPLHLIVSAPFAPPITLAQMEAFNTASFRHWFYVERFNQVIRDEAAMSEAERAEYVRMLSRPRPVTSFFAGLTPDQQVAVLAYDGPEDYGDPAYLRNAEKDYGI